MFKNIVIVVLLIIIGAFTVFAVAVYQSRQEDPMFQSGTVFALKPLPAQFDTLQWQLLNTDGKGDQRTYADGEAISYYFDKANDSLWFKMKQFNSINPNYPSLSFAIDSDNDQATGENWYGTDKTLTYDLLILLGAKRDSQKYVGYNRIGKMEGTVAFYFDIYTDTYFAGFSVADLNLSDSTLHFIPSVGSKTLWSDDLIDKGFLMIKLN